MSRGSGGVLASLCLFVPLLAAGCARLDSGVQVKRFTTALTVLADGSLAVDETFDVNFLADGISQFHRRERVWRHDGVSAVSGAMDGQDFPVGQGAGRLTVGRGPDLDATWNFEAGAAASTPSPSSTAPPEWSKSPVSGDSCRGVFATRTPTSPTLRSR
jgi:hypothetical protein